MMRSILEGLKWLIGPGGLRFELEDLKRRITDVERLVSQTAWQPGDLRFCEESKYSQNGEDGIIEEIFRRIGTTNRTFVEFGVQSGEQCNCRKLAEDGWTGLLMDSGEDNVQALRARYANNPGVICRKAHIRSDNIEMLLREERVPAELDLLSIDIDGNDYWVWAAVTQFRPRVVVIEYNATYGPPVTWIMPEDNAHQWKGDDYFGASLQSLVDLAIGKGYALVTTDSSGVNAFFVRADLVNGERFLLHAVGYHYSPPSYGKRWYGHPATGA